MATDCPFCDPDIASIVAENEHCFAIRDRYPLADGHSLVIPRRHLSSVFSASTAELSAIWALVVAVRSELDRRIGPDGFTVGINDGAAAGQTIDHGHVHVVPRWRGDVPDPRGGIRWVVPDRAPYWQAG